MKENPFILTMHNPFLISSSGYKFVRLCCVWVKDL